MTKIRAAGSCAEAQWDAVRAIGQSKLGDKVSNEAARAEGINEIAHVLGLDKGTVRNIFNPDRPEQLSFERAGLLARMFDLDVLAKWLAQESGGLFVRLPEAGGNIEKLTAAGVRQVGTTAAAVIEALSEESEDGSALSIDEARKLGDDARRIAHTFMEIASHADQAMESARASKGMGSRPVELVRAPRSTSSVSREQ